MNATQVRADFRGKRKLSGEDGEEGDGQKKGKRGNIDGAGEYCRRGGRKIDGAGEE
jgi:hypothetical protein